MSAMGMHARSARRLRFRLAAVSLAALAFALATPPSAPAAIPLQTGDLLITINGGIARYAPNGAFQSMLVPAGSGVGSICLDPSGDYVIAPGAGLYDRFGNLLPSDWASLPGPECSVDHSGNVYVGIGPFSTAAQPPPWSATIGKYALDGVLVRDYTAAVDASAATFRVTGLDVVPGQCTLDYVNDGGALLLRYNICTGAQEPALTSLTPGICDTLRIRQDGQIVVACDDAAVLLDAAGSQLRSFQVDQTSDLRYVALAPPHENGFWLATYRGLITHYRYSGMQLAQFSVSGSPAGIAVVGGSS